MRLEYTAETEADDALNELNVNEDDLIEFVNDNLSHESDGSDTEGGPDNQDIDASEDMQFDV